MKFSDFKGNYKQILEFQTLIKNNDNGIILIIGEASTGKSSFYEMLENENKYDILLLDDQNFNETIIQNFSQSKTIINFFKKLKKIIFIDDVDTITNIGKHTLTNMVKYKQNVLFVVTVKSKEEKKIRNTWKKLIDHRIYLNLLDYKDCFQVVLKHIENREDIDTSKLIELIKALDCNLSKILLQLDTVTDSWDDIDPLDNNMDIFHDNIYSTVDNIYHKDLSESYITSLCSKDSSVLSSLVHENILNIKTNIDDYINFYTVFTECDVVDKHIYVSCAWGINWNMLNMYRFTKLNKSLYPFHNKVKPFQINFTQQFTKLSSQVGMKKKLLLLPKPFHNHALDILRYISTKKIDSLYKDDKIIKDLIVKFQKEFESDTDTSSKSNKKIEISK